MEIFLTFTLFVENGPWNSRQETAPNVVYINATSLQTVPDVKTLWSFGAAHIKKGLNTKSW